MTPEQVQKDVDTIKSGISVYKGTYNEAAYRLILHLLEQPQKQPEMEATMVSAGQIIPDDGKRWIVTDIIKSETLKPGDIVRMSEQPKDKHNVFVRETDYTIHSIMDKDYTSYLIVQELKETQ